MRSNEFSMANPVCFAQVDERTPLLHKSKKTSSIWQGRRLIDQENDQKKKKSASSSTLSKIASLIGRGLMNTNTNTPIPHMLPIFPLPKRQ